MTTAPKTRKYTDIFTTTEHENYIELYFLGEHIGNYDNWREVEQAKHEITGY